MAARDFFDVQALARQMKILGGRFFPQGAGAIVNANNVGRGWTVARTGVGAYAVTFLDAYPFLLGVFGMIQLNALADQKLIVSGAITTPIVPTAAAFTLQSLAVAASSEIAANANNSVMFVAILSNDNQF